MSKSKKSKSPSLSPSNPNNKKTPDKFCHFKNAMYMGEMKYFEKEGKGIMLHDSGQISITSHQRDQIHGNVLLITKNMQMFSIIYSFGQLSQVVTKNNQYLIYLKYKMGVPDGKCVFVDFKQEEIYHLVYKNGVLDKKIKSEDKDLQNKIFNHFIYSALIPINHLKTLNFQFKNAGFQVTKKNSTITVGYYKGGFLNGIGFTLSKEQNQANVDYCLVQKGWYKNSYLCGIGEKRFSNGNLYIGQFNQNIFDGRGFLYNTKKKNWVKGLFKDGTMIDMSQYGREQQSSKNPKIQEMLESLHKKKSSWVNKNISFQNIIPFENMYQQILRKIKESVPDRFLDLQQKKQQMLKKIQQTFCPDFVIPQSTSKQSQRLTIERFTATFSQSKELNNSKSDKKVINSFQNQYDKTNNKLRLSPALCQTTRERKNRNMRTSKNLLSTDRNLMNSKESLVSFEKTPTKRERSKRKDSQLELSTTNILQNKSFNKTSKLFSPSKSSRPISQIKPQNKKQKQQPIIEPFNNQSTLKYSYIEKRELSQLDPKSNRSQFTQSKSRRHKIFNETLKTYNNSKFHIDLQDSKQEKGQNSANLSKQLKAMGLAKASHRSKLFSQQKPKNDEDLPTFRYSRFQNEKSFQKLGSKGKIF